MISSQRLNAATRAARAAGFAVMATGMLLLGAYALGARADESGPPHPRGAQVLPVGGQTQPAPVDPERRDAAARLALGDPHILAFGDHSDIILAGAEQWTLNGASESGVALFFQFRQPLSGRFRFIGAKFFDEGTAWPPYQRVFIDATVQNMPGLYVLVDLASGALVELRPSDGTVILDSPSAAKGPQLEDLD
jgi:hypothetical protein